MAKVQQLGREVAMAPLGFTEVEVPAGGLGSSGVLHVVKEIIGFVLYMHHQIPSVLQHLEKEFDSLKEEYERLASATEPAAGEGGGRAAALRERNARKREAKQGIRRVEKLVKSVNNSISALQQSIGESVDLQSVMLVLGGSLVRPLHVYEILFSIGSFDSVNGSRAAEAVSRKAIRSLISNGVGSLSYSGPSKLFILIKCDNSFNQPLHFLPKRDFRFSKKVIPFKIHIKCASSGEAASADSHRTTGAASCHGDVRHNLGGEAIWFQCKHIIKGLACRAPPEE